MSFQAREGCERCVGHVKAPVSAAAVRVIYYNRLVYGEIWLLLIYTKSARENIPAHILRAIKAEVDNA